MGKSQIFPGIRIIRLKLDDILKKSDRPGESAGHLSQGDAQVQFRAGKAGPQLHGGLKFASRLRELSGDLSRGCAPRNQSEIVLR